MTKVKTAVSAALVAAAATVGAPAAFAITNPNTGPTDLIAAVWNTSTNTSYVVDLGVPFSSLTSGNFTNPAGFSTSWQLDGGNLATDLGGAVQQFSVFAVNGLPTSGHTIQGQQFLFGDNGGTNPGVGTIELHNNIVVGLASYINTNIPGASTSLLGSGSAYWGSCASGNPGCAQGIYGTALLNGIGNAAPGTALTFANILAVTDGAKGQAGPTFNLIGNATGPGLFTFSGDILTYTLAGSGGTVPLPAAGWLLVSGLLGLVGVGRRRREAVAA